VPLLPPPSWAPWPVFPLACASWPLSPLDCGPPWMCLKFPVTPGYMFPLACAPLVCTSQFCVYPTSPLVCAALACVPLVGLYPTCPGDSCFVSCFCQLFLFNTTDFYFFNCFLLKTTEITVAPILKG